MLQSGLSKYSPGVGGGVRMTPKETMRPEVFFPGVGRAGAQKGLDTCQVVVFSRGGEGRNEWCKMTQDDAR